MAVDLTALVDPAHTVLVTQECQGGVIGERAALPVLAEAARKAMIPNAVRLVTAARAAGVPVVHCTAARRADGLGSNHNARLFMGMLKTPVPLLPGTEASQVIPELGPDERDVVLTRLHGVGPMGGTDLDAVAGVPEDYAEAVLDNTVALLATLTTTDDLVAAWT